MRRWCQRRWRQSPTSYPGTGHNQPDANQCAGLPECALCCHCYWYEQPASHLESEQHRGRQFHCRYSESKRTLSSANCSTEPICSQRDRCLPSRPTEVGVCRRHHHRRVYLDCYKPRLRLCIHQWKAAIHRHGHRDQGSQGHMECQRNCGWIQQQRLYRLKWPLHRPPICAYTRICDGRCGGARGFNQVGCGHGEYPALDSC